MSALFSMTIGRAFFGGLVIGLLAALLFGRWSVPHVARHLRYIFSRRVAAVIHALAEMVEESDEEKRREIFFTAVEAAFAAHKREDS